MFQVIKGTPAVYDPNASYVDSGWTIAGGIATHGACNAGTFYYNLAAFLQVGHYYVITYTVVNYSSGGVYLTLGATDGTNRTANGTYTETLQCTTNTNLGFYSNGALSIENIKIYDQANGPQTGYTVAFHDGDKKKWGLTISITPEMSVRFLNDLYMFQNGGIWKQNSNPVRNNFFGTQYNSIIHIICNHKPTEDKIYYSMRVKSNGIWAALQQGDISIPPTPGKTAGMTSRLTPSQFKRLQNDYFADFLRNMSDPRFGTITDALFKGAELRGEYMELVLTNSDTTEIVLFEIDIKTASSMFTY